MRYPCLNVGESPSKTEQEATDSFVLLLKAAANTLDAMQKSADQRDEKEV